MTFECYSQRLLNPFRGSVNCIRYKSADAVTADGVQWDLYVSNEWLLQGLSSSRKTQVSDIRYGSWSAATGLQRGPRCPTDDFRALEEMGDTLYQHLLEVHAQIPFPFLDRFELWLLDNADRPLALIDSALRLEDIDLRQPTRWNPGLNCRKTFAPATPAGLPLDPATGGSVADYLAHYVNSRTRDIAAAQVFQRAPDGSGSGVAGINLDPQLEQRQLADADFPDLLLDRGHHDAPHRQLIDDFIRWQAPWLLLLPSLDGDMRRTFEQQAREQPAKLVQAFHCYPEIIDRSVIDAARVEVRLRETVPEQAEKQEALSTFYIELNSETGE